LIADDHPPTRAGVRMALERDGLEVCAEVANASDAVDAALRERPDVCLLDVHMPGGGTAAASMISCHLPGTVVLMLTVSHEGEDLFESLRQGARGYLLKEMDPAKLPVAVRAALEGEVTLPRELAAALVDEFRNGARVRRPGRQALGRPELTKREWDVLELLTEGAGTAEIAKRLFLSRVTVRRHVSNILNKLGVSSREEAVRLVRAEEP
jgi:DNA-binding NarL/FixJ family response regulator